MISLTDSSARNGRSAQESSRRWLQRSPGGTWRFLCRVWEPNTHCPSCGVCSDAFIFQQVAANVKMRRPSSLSHPSKRQMLRAPRHAARRFSARIRTQPGRIRGVPFRYRKTGPLPRHTPQSWPTLVSMAGPPTRRRPTSPVLAGLRAGTMSHPWQAMLAVRHPPLWRGIGSRAANLVSDRYSTSGPRAGLPMRSPGLFVIFPRPPGFAEIVRPPFALPCGDPATPCEIPCPRPSGTIGRPGWPAPRAVIVAGRHRLVDHRARATHEGPDPRSAVAGPAANFFNKLSLAFRASISN